jgi:hypothetical protein
MLMCFDGRGYDTDNSCECELCPFCVTVVESGKQRDSSHSSDVHPNKLDARCRASERIGEPIR